MEYADMGVLRYDKLWRDHIPSFEDGERRKITEHADRWDISSAFLDMSAFAKCDGRYISRDDALRITEKPTWLTGTPPRPGRYFCRMKGNLDPEDEPPKEFRFDWDGQTWYFTGRPIMKGMLVVGWWPLPDMEGKA
jgi:hypothetical protein